MFINAGRKMCSCFIEICLNKFLILLKINEFKTKNKHSTLTICHILKSRNGGYMIVPNKDFYPVARKDTKDHAK